MASQASHQRWFPTRWRRVQLRTYWPEFLALLVFAECAGAAALASHFNVADEIPWEIYFLLWLIPAGVASMVALAAWLWKLVRAHEEHPLRATFAKLCSFDRRSYVEVIVPVVVMAPFMASFTTFKTLIENFGTFTVDLELSRIDGVFGFQPWQVTHALIGPLATVVLDRMYFAWLAISQLTLVAVLFIPQLRRQRGQVLLSFVLSWLVLGVFMAAICPSVGPCFFGKLYHPDVYAGLLTHLRSDSNAHFLTALGIQDRLWTAHSGQVISVGSGVSAMPSMHVSIATITALFLRRIGLTWLGATWLGAIWIGSFHLGWHYASDGLVSIVGTILIWKAVSHLLSDDTPPARDSVAQL
jgi:hypothetical protein